LQTLYAKFIENSESPSEKGAGLWFTASELKYKADFTFAKIDNKIRQDYGLAQFTVV